MKKYLFILISLLSLNFLAAQTYSVKAGETLLSISKKQNISYRELLQNNPKISMSPNQLDVGQELMLGYSRSPYELSCFDEAHISEIYIDQSVNDRFVECFSLIEENEDLSFFNNERDEYFWKTFNSNTAFITYLKNKYMYEFANNKTETNEEKDLIEFIKQAAINGNFAAWQMWDKWEYSFGDIPDNAQLKIYEDHKILADLFNGQFQELGYKNFIEHCKDHINSKAIPFNDLTAVYRACGSLSFILGDKTSNTFFESAIDHVLSNKNDVIDLREISHVAATFNYLRVSDKRYLAIEYVKSYLAKICDKCASTNDYLNFVNRLENDSSKYIQFRFWDKFFILLSASYLDDMMVREINYDEFKKQTDHLLEIYLSKYSQLEGGISEAESDGVLIDLYLDIAEGSIINNDCRRAYKYYDMALSIKSDGQSKRVDIEFAPFNLMHCYKGSHKKLNSPFYSSDEIELSLSLANRYWQNFFKVDDPKKIEIFELDFNNAKQNESGTIFNEFHPVEIAYIVINNFYSFHKEYPIEKIATLLQKVSNLFFEINDGYEISSVENYLRDIIIIYTDIHNKYYERLNNFQKQDILNPIDLLNFHRKAILYKDFIDLKINADDKRVNDLQIKLNVLNEEIISKKATGDYQSLLALHRKSAKIINEIMLLDNNLNNLLNYETPQLNALQKSLTTQEFSIFSIQSNHAGRSFFVSNNKIDIFPTLGRVSLSGLSSKLRESLDPEIEYNLEIANEIYNKQYYFLNDLAPKDSVIFFFEEEEFSIPPSVLVKSYDNTFNYKKAMLTANFLLKDYIFANIYQLPKSFETKNIYMKKFLGLGNSTTYHNLGLPDLYNVNDEIKQLALASNAEIEDLLINEDATKNNFLNKIKQSYERIVISTHSVPRNWNGLTNEPALVMNSPNDDFFLTPTEIIKNDINSEMVVLSSCNSSVNGSSKLFKSFLIAGAKSVLHSNWDLESEFASEYTNELFTALWFSSAEKHFALRDVSLKYLNDYSNERYWHPVFWGNFSLAYRTR